MIIGDGFLPLHIEVLVQEGSLDSIYEEIKNWKKEFRNSSLSEDFPDKLKERILSFGEVLEFTLEGPQSSVIIPLRMIQSSGTQRTVSMSTVIGTGPVASMIRQYCQEWGIALDAKIVEEGDSPLEFSIRDVIGNHRSLKMYLCSRTKFRKVYKMGNEDICGIIANRYNKGILETVKKASSSGATVSIRPHTLDRYTKPEDYLEMIPYADHLILSSRNGVLQKIASALGYKIDKDLVTTGPEMLNSFSQELIALGNSNKVLVLNDSKTGENWFFTKNIEPSRIGKPGGYDDASRVSRIQGAMFIIKKTFNDNLDDFAQKVVKMAYQGTEKRPWLY
jgi:hypothetical protein